jgi:hypothetical protein
MNVKLTLSENQLRVIQNALELDFRMHMGQEYCGLADDLAFQNVEMPPSGTHEHDKVFNECIWRRDDGVEALRNFFNVTLGRDLQRHKKTPDVICGIDIWHVIRHWFWEQREKTEPYEHWTVDAGEPMQFAPEPLPTIERVEDGERV